MQDWNFLVLVYWTNNFVHNLFLNMLLFDCDLVLMNCLCLFFVLLLLEHSLVLFDSVDDHGNLSWDKFNNFDHFLLVAVLVNGRRILLMDMHDLNVGSCWDFTLVFNVNDFDFIIAVSDILVSGLALDSLKHIHVALRRHRGCFFNLFVLSINDGFFD